MYKEISTNYNDGLGGKNVTEVHIGENEKTSVKRWAHRRGKEPITILIEL